MYHTVYKITNLLNGMCYVGKHSTKNLDDNYMGSSKHLNEAVEKDGVINFKKEILFSSQFEEEALEYEAKIVNTEFINNPRTYNKTLGGRGSWTLRNHEDFAKKERITKWDQSIFGKNLGKKGNFEW